MQCWTIKKWWRNRFFTSIIRESTKCNEREAAECVIEVLYKKQEEAITSVAIAQGLITDNKKMDEFQIEAILSEAGL
jgi:hypothetical protein